MQEKIYRMYGVDAAIEWLRPKAKWEIYNGKFVRWDDPRPCPTWEEIVETMDKIKAFEDSIETVWTEDQLADFGAKQKEIEKALS